MAIHIGGEKLPFIRKSLVQAYFQSSVLSIWCKHNDIGISSPDVLSLFWVCDVIVVLTRIQLIVDSVNFTCVWISVGERFVHSASIDRIEKVNPIPINRAIR